MDERRNQYRVEAAFGEDAEIHLQVAKGNPVPGTLVNISSGGCMVLVDNHKSGPVTVGRRLEVVMDTGSRKLTIPGQITRADLEDAEDGALVVSVGVLFDAWGETRRALAPRLRSLFNERRAVRVQPGPDERIDVKCHRGDEVQIGRLRDISVMGIGVLIRAAGAEGWEIGDVVRVNFSLPNIPYERLGTARDEPRKAGYKWHRKAAPELAKLPAEQVMIAAEVRHLTSTAYGLRVHVGLRFDADALSNMSGVRRVMERYIGYIQRPKRRR